MDDLYKKVEDEGTIPSGNGFTNNNNVMEAIDLRKTVNGLQNKHEGEQKAERTSIGIIRNLFWKRFVHFRRNYKLMICILVLPVIFEIIAMGFMKIRPPGDHDNSIEFNRSMYPNSYEFYSNENPTEFSEGIYKEFEDTCAQNKNCYLFEKSSATFDWLLETHEQFVGRRYGGVTINNTRAVVWYNNKGYHSMPLYLSILHSAAIKRELNDSSYGIRTHNHPLKLGEEELSVSSM